MELLDIVDEKGNPTGETVPREVAHREGIRHRTAHVWIFRRRGGVVQILLQKRSDNKDSDPGCYDISSAGHVQAGDEFLPSAIRELKEELGIEAGEEDLAIIHSPVGMPGRALNTPLVQALAKGKRFAPRHCARCLKTCDPAKVPYCITHALIEAVKGNVEEGLFFCGANVGRLDRMYTVRELMDELTAEWRHDL